MQAGDSVPRVVSVLWLKDELGSLGFLLVALYMQLVFNTKRKPFINHSLQFICNQGTHSVQPTCFWSELRAHLPDDL